MQVLNAFNVHMYSFKSENSMAPHAPLALTLWISNSSNINVYGHGGNALPSSGASRALYMLDNVSDVRITNVVPQHEWGGAVIYDKMSSAWTSECSRPVLYRVD